MSVLPSINIPAPDGMDVTADTVQTAVTRCQLLTNFVFDRRGFLLAQARLINLLPQPIPTSPDTSNPFPDTTAGRIGAIDGIAYYYQATIVNPQSPPFPTDLLLIFSAGRLYYSIPSSDPFTQVFGQPIFLAATNLGNSYFQGGVFVGKRVRSATLNDELIVVQDGGVQPQRFFSGPTYGTHYWQAGINAPPAGTASVVAGPGITGTYTYKVTYYDERGRESSPSPVSNTISPANQQGHLVIAWSPDFSRQGFDRQIKGAYVYRNASGGVVWYRVGNVAFGTKNPALPYTLTTGDWILHTADANDKATDAEIQTQAIAPNPGENDLPNPASLIAVHKNRVFLNDVANNATLQVSNLLSPTQWTSVPAAPPIATDGVRLTVGTDQGDPITALVEFGSVLFIGKRRGCYFLYGDDTTNFVIRPIQSGGNNSVNPGILAPDSAARCDNIVCYLSKSGVYAASYNRGDVAQKISKEIEAWLQSLPQTDRENSFGFFVDNRYHLVIGQTLFVYSLDVQGWATYTFGSGTYDLGIPGFPPLLIHSPYDNPNSGGVITLPNGDDVPSPSTGSPPFTAPSVPSQPGNNDGGCGCPPGMMTIMLPDGTCICVTPAQGGPGGGGAM